MEKVILVTVNRMYSFAMEYSEQALDGLLEANPVDVQAGRGGIESVAKQEYSSIRVLVMSKVEYLEMLLEAQTKKEEESQHAIRVPDMPQSTVQYPVNVDAPPREPKF